MSKGLNHCEFIGNLTDDPKIKDVGETQVSNFSIAVNQSVKRDGEWVDEVTFVNVVCWGSLAKFSDYLKKGFKVYVSGKLVNRSWEDKDGVKKYKTEILLNDLMNLTSKKDAEDGMGSRRTDKSDPSEEPESTDVEDISEDVMAEPSEEELTPKAPKRKPPF